MYWEGTEMVDSILIMASPIVLKAFSPWVTNGPGFLIVCNKDSS